MKTPPTGTSESIALMLHFLENPRPARRALAWEPIPARVDLTKELDFAEVELRTIAVLTQCKHEKMDAAGFCTSCGLNKPGIATFDEFLKSGSGRSRR